MFVPLAIAALTSTGLLPLEQFHWQGRLQTGHSIEIKGMYGSIHAQAAVGSHAEVIAYRSDLSIEPSSIKVDVVDRAGDLLFIAQYPGSSAEGAAPIRVDFTVRVPAGVRFIGRTVNGSVEARALKSDAAAYTVNGDVHMSTAGDARAETVNGSIVASLGRASPRRNLRFSTVNGAITLDMPMRPNASVHAKTLHGAIRSDFRVQVESHIGSRSAHALLGKGGPELNLNTVNGDIHLRRACGLEL